jgi:hypothetical protein
LRRRISTGSHLHVGPVHETLVGQDFAEERTVVQGFGVRKGLGQRRFGRSVVAGEGGDLRSHGKEADTRRVDTLTESPEATSRHLEPFDDPAAGAHTQDDAQSNGGHPVGITHSLVCVHRGVPVLDCGFPVANSVSGHAPSEEEGTLCRLIGVGVGEGELIGLQGLRVGGAGDSLVPGEGEETHGALRIGGVARLAEMVSDLSGVFAGVAGQTLESVGHPGVEPLATQCRHSGDERLAHQLVRKGQL